MAFLSVSRRFLRPLAGQWAAMTVFSDATVRLRHCKHWKKATYEDAGLAGKGSRLSVALSRWNASVFTESFDRTETSELYRPVGTSAGGLNFFRFCRFSKK